MPLDFSVVEKFVSDYREAMQDKSLLRHARYKILARLRDELQTLLNGYEAFDGEIASHLLRNVETARTYEVLRECHEKAVDRIGSFFMENKTVPDVHDLFRMIRGAITVRVLQMVEGEMREAGLGEPPVDYVWIGLGSEGRDEQTMLTDQDNMVVHGTAEGKSRSDRIERYFEEFSKKAVDRLDDVGFQKCKGNVMPSNEKWRGSIEVWKKRLDDRMVYEKGSFEDLDIIILTDARPIRGNEALLGRVMGFFFDNLANNRRIMNDFVRSAVLMPTAITFFGNFKVEKTGDYKDMFNLKLLGWAPLIFSVRMLALANRLYETNTLKRIRLLRERGVIKNDMENDLTDAYLTFVKFRIMNQIRKRNNNGISSIMDTNYVRPDMLGPEEQEKMRKAMKAVESVQKYMEEVLLFGQPL
jgi:CBS domain-containing protein